MKNILVIAPHADDEVLGCGATMAKLAHQGNNVYVLIANIFFSKHLGLVIFSMYLIGVLLGIQDIK